ncbi:HepT-like ribonuclease domain-containing protein [Amycolatopsis sp. GM8]|uniref:HepT-like ribonuclease domain-containing protein n=1 Tax=Amycolatopsis sp. GM8 TaxID=2896530 RepID=UPI0035ABB111
MELHRLGRSGGASFARPEGTSSRDSLAPPCRPADLRNRIVHGYWSIDLEILHATATEQLSGLVKALPVTG